MGNLLKELGLTELWNLLERFDAKGVTAADINVVRYSPALLDLVVEPIIRCTELMTTAVNSGDDVALEAFDRLVKMVGVDNNLLFGIAIRANSSMARVAAVNLITDEEVYKKIILDRESDLAVVKIAIQKFYGTDRDALLTLLNRKRSEMRPEVAHLIEQVIYLCD
jgi:hypothetical protein